MCLAHLLEHGQRHVVDGAGVGGHQLQPLARADDAIARRVRLRERLRRSGIASTSAGTRGTRISQQSCISTGFTALASTPAKARSGAIRHGALL